MDVNTLKGVEKAGIAQMAMLEENSVLEVALHTGLKVDTIRSWKRATEKGVVLSDGSSGGAPKLLNDADRQILMKMVTKPSAYGVSAADYVDQALKLARKNVRSRGRQANTLTKISKRTLERLDLDMGLVIKNAEQTTIARARAVADIRNTASFIAAQLLMGSGTHPSLIVNIDATSFTVGRDTTATTQIVLVEGEKQTKPRKAMPEDNPNHGQGLYSIKYYLTISADGVAGTPVYVIAHAGMKAEEFKAYEIKGIGFSVGQEDSGYVVLCQSRSCNKAFYLWLVEKVIIPYCVKQRVTNGLRADSPAFFQLDGEPKQMECFQSPELLELLRANCVIVGKPPASTTATTQPCDGGNCFKASKAHLCKVTDETVSYREVVYKRIRSQLAEHNTLYAKDKLLSQAHLVSASWGILRIQHALIDTVKTDTVYHSFQKVGVYDYSLVPPGPNIATMLANCKDFGGEHLFPEDETAIRASMPQLIAIMRDHGEITEEQFELNHIRANIASKTPKDLLNVPNRRYLFLTNKDLIAKEYLKRVTKAEKEVATKAKKDLKAMKVKNTSNSSSSVALEPVKAVSIGVKRPPVQGVGSSSSSCPPKVARRESHKYICANPACNAVSRDGEMDNGWLQCECCDVSVWTCGHCAKYMDAHESQHMK